MMSTVKSDRHRVQSSGGFELPLMLAEAFSLFTAEGESRWVPGWSPEILGPLPQHAGLVFLTGTSPKQTIWTVLESDPGEVRHRYSRVTPGHSAGIVDVQLHPTEAGCRVEVSYDMTALAEDETILAGYSDVSFDQMMAEWRSMIVAMLRREEILTPA